MKLTEAYLQVLAEEDKKKAPPFAKDTDKDDDGEGMDPVGKEDGDVDNDGDKDESDVYLKKRRDTIKKASKKDDAKGDAEAVEESSDSMQRGGKKAAANIAAAGKDKAIQRGAAKKVRELRKKGKSDDVIQGVLKVHFPSADHKAAMSESVDLSDIQALAKACYENVEVLQINKDGTYDALVNSRFVETRDIADLEEDYDAFEEGIDLKKRDPNRADRDVLAPEAQGEKDLVDVHDVEIVDGAKLEAGKPDVKVTSQAKPRAGDKRNAEPMKKVKEQANNWLSRTARNLTR